MTQKVEMLQNELDIIGNAILYIRAFFGTFFGPIFINCFKHALIMGYFAVESRLMGIPTQ